MPVGAGLSSSAAIEVAVAGFKPSELDITAQQNVLIIRGERSETSGLDYVHRGIANHAFERRFALADHIQVRGAEMKDGLLSLELVREIPRDRLLVETDSPYLTPRDLKPQPKARRNEPAFLPHIVRTVARALQRDVEDVAAETTRQPAVDRWESSRSRQRHAKPAAKP